MIKLVSKSDSLPSMIATISYFQLLSDRIQEAQGESVEFTVR